MANEQMSLGDILSDEQPAAPDPQPSPEPAPAAAPEPAAAEAPAPAPQPQKSNRKAWQDKEQAAQGRVRDPDTGQFVKAEEKPAEPAKAPEPAKAAEPEKQAEPAKAAEPAKPAAPVQEFTEKEKAFLRAAQEERQKRQQLEARLKELEAGKTAEPAKTFWDDPEGALKAHEERIRQEATNARLRMAEFTARQRHSDFDEKIAVFSSLVQDTPGLVQQWLASPDPAEFAYKIGKNHKELQEVGGIEELRAKIERDTESRVRAKIEAELKAKAEALAKERAAIPPSLSEARSAAAPNRPVWSGPTPLDSILGKG